MIQFKDVSFTYTGETDVLSHINFTIPDGQFVCVLGANGSGKSTLSKLINALLLPDSGEVYTLGLDTADPDNLYVIRSGAGSVFQNPDDQLVTSLVENDVAFGPENLGIENPELRERVPARLKQLVSPTSNFEKPPRSPAVKNNVLPLQVFLLWIPKFSFLMRQAPCLIPAVDEGLCACAKNFMNAA